MQSEEGRGWGKPAESSVVFEFCHAVKCKKMCVNSVCEQTGSGSRRYDFSLRVSVTVHPKPELLVLITELRQVEPDGYFQIRC